MATRNSRPGRSERRCDGCGRASRPAVMKTALLFDLDGTLVDSVYQHVLAWKQALDSEGIELSVWRIHRRIGMSGGLFVSALLRETGLSLSPADIDRLQQAHAAQYRAQMDSVTALPGARELLGAYLLVHLGGALAALDMAHHHTAAVEHRALGVAVLGGDRVAVVHDSLLVGPAVHTDRIRGRERRGEAGATEHQHAQGGGNGQT